MINSFRDRGTEDIFLRVDSKAARRTCPPLIWLVARRKLLLLESARRLHDLLFPLGNDLHPLARDRRGQHAIQWRMSKSRTTTTEGCGTIPAKRASLFAPADLLVNVPPRLPTHPGEMLREDFLPDLGWAPEELAARLRLPPAVVTDLLAERAPVTPELALRLGRLFHQTPALWIKMQLAYDLHLALVSADVELVEPVECEPVLQSR